MIASKGDLDDAKEGAKREGFSGFHSCRACPRYNLLVYIPCSHLRHISEGAGEQHTGRLQAWLTAAGTTATSRSLRRKDRIQDAMK